MAHCVFIHKEGSIYDDSPAVRYHFPKSYLERAKACIGDWIVYYEPVKEVASRGYWAVVRVSDITPDPANDGMYYAWMEKGSLLEFNPPVPRKIDGQLVESGVPNAQWSVRPLSKIDFNRIIGLGLPDDIDLLPRDDETPLSLVRDERLGVDFGDRDRSIRLMSRPIRDRAFRGSVLRAYDERCALTGLKLINGGGRAEVEAAHIQSVAANGPDMVANGLALSGTVHWMFDRGLVTLDDDLTILISRHVNDRSSIEGLVNRNGKATLPIDRRERPHPLFLKWHRENCFKQ
jgi:putative restriction endonuclease